MNAELDKKLKEIRCPIHEEAVEACWICRAYKDAVRRASEETARLILREGDRLVSDDEGWAAIREVVRECGGEERNG